VPTEDATSAQDAETVYFDESAKEAQALVNQVLTAFDEVLASVGGEQRQALMRSMGLKMEQLKAELQELDNMHNDG
jgi:hypothetical protein